MVVYILYSDSLDKFYTGFTTNIEQRMQFHNDGLNAFCKKGIPWKLIATFQVPDKTEGLALERKLKRMVLNDFLKETIYHTLYEVVSSHARA